MSEEKNLYHALVEIVMPMKENGISMTQIYKQAGNSIVVNVLEALFKELFKAIAI